MIGQAPRQAHALLKEAGIDVGTDPQVIYDALNQVATSSPEGADVKRGILDRLEEWLVFADDAQHVAGGWLDLLGKKPYQVGNNNAGTRENTTMILVVVVVIILVLFIFLRKK